MSGYPVTCIHFADRVDMLDALTIIGSEDREMPYLCHQAELFVVLKSRDGIRASGFLSSAGIQPTFVEHRLADREEAQIFDSMSDSQERGYYDAPEPDYCEAGWGGMTP